MPFLTQKIRQIIWLPTTLIIGIWLANHIQKATEPILKMFSLGDPRYYTDPITWQYGMSLGTPINSVFNGLEAICVLGGMFLAAWLLMPSPKRKRLQRFIWLLIVFEIAIFVTMTIIHGKHKFGPQPAYTLLLIRESITFTFLLLSLYMSHHNIIPYVRNSRPRKKSI